jgi:hypothetical protein
VKSNRNGHSNKRSLTWDVGRPHESDREGKCKESYLHNNLTPQPRPAVRHRELSGGALRNNPPRSARYHRTYDEHRHASEVPPEGCPYLKHSGNSVLFST